MTSSTAALLLYVCIGAPLMSLALERRMSPSSCGTGALLLLFSLPAELMLLSFAGIPWTPAVVTALGLLNLTTAAAVAARSRTFERPSFRPPSALEAVCAIAASVLVAGYVVWTMTGPAWDWDFWMIWGAKGRAFHEAKGVDFAFLSNPFHAHVRPWYPPLLPTLMSSVATIDGRWDDSAFGILYVIAGLSLAAVVYGELRRELSAERAAAGALLSLVSCLSERIGLADGLLFAAYTAAVLLLRRVLTDSSVRLSAAAGVLLGVCALLKDEGLAAMLITCVLFAALGAGQLRRQRARVVLAAVIPAVGLALLWLVPRMVHSLGGYGPRPEPLSEILAPARLTALGRAVITFFPASGPVWLALVAATLVLGKRAAKERFVLLVVALQFATYVATYVFIARGHPWDPNWYDISWHVQTSWPRLVEQLTPLAIFVTLIMVLPYVPVPVALQRRNLSKPASLNAQGELN